MKNVIITALLMMLVGVGTTIYTVGYVVYCLVMGVIL